jgi:hypothetical protein
MSCRGLSRRRLCGPRLFAFLVVPVAVQLNGEPHRLVGKFHEPVVHPAQEGVLVVLGAEIEGKVTFPRYLVRDDPRFGLQIFDGVFALSAMRDLAEIPASLCEEGFKGGWHPRFLPKTESAECRGIWQWNAVAFSLPCAARMRRRKARQRAGSLRVWLRWFGIGSKLRPKHAVIVQDYKFGIQEFAQIALPGLVSLRGIHRLVPGISPKCAQR